MTEQEEIDQLVIKRFSDQHLHGSFNPVLYTIPAYKEKDSISNVLETLPKEVCSLKTTTLVVVDGDDDGTSDIVREQGAYVVVSPTNRGQGASLRVAYRLAQQFKSRVVITIDADGQCSPSDIEAVASPVIYGQADISLGSRIRGATDSTDNIRNLGVKVFSGLITRMTGQFVTDPANPLRAFDVTAINSLKLTQDQYQSSEVIISAIKNRLRVTEVPALMKVRTEGKSKKGGSLKYGYNFSKVVFSTYLKQRSSKHI